MENSNEIISLLKEILLEQTKILQAIESSLEQEIDLRVDHAKVSLHCYEAIHGNASNEDVKYGVLGLSSIFEEKEKACELAKCLGIPNSLVFSIVPRVMTQKMIYK